MKSQDDNIATQGLIFIDFACAYDNVYTDITANNFTVVSDSLEGNSEIGLGQFNLSLKQYTDIQMSVEAKAGDEFPLGGTMYFQLEMENPISTIEWVISGISLNSKSCSFS